MRLDENRLELIAVLGGFGVIFFISYYLSEKRIRQQSLPHDGWQLHAGVEDRHSEPARPRTPRVQPP